MSLLELKQISKSFAGKNVLDDVSLQVGQGEIAALLGQTGSGKSTIAKIIAGQYTPDTGQVLLGGQELSAKRSLTEKKAIQFVFQNTYASFNPKRRVLASIEQARQVYSLDCSLTSMQQLFGKVQLSWDLAGRYPHQLSGGQMQRACLARALASEPQILLADEPTSALDASIKLEILRLFRDLRDNTQLGILLITHDLRSIQGLADCVYRVQAGRLNLAVNVAAQKG